MKDNQLQVFSNQQLGDIRVTEIANQPYFVATDVATALGYVNSRKAILDHVDEDDVTKRDIIDSLGRVQQTTVINESGMYSLIFGSKLAQAKVFKRWVTSEVLPAIRQTGGYNISAQSAQAPPAGVEAPRIEFYNNVACISAGWLIRAGIISLTYYSKLVYFGKITRVRRANKGRTALVAYDSLPEKHKALIRDRFGVLGVPTLPMNNDRALAMVAEICRIEDTELRLRLLSKAIY